MSYGSVESQASYVSKYGDTMQGSLNMNGNKLTGLSIATDDTDAVNVEYLNNRTIDGTNLWELIGTVTFTTTENQEFSFPHFIQYYNKIFIVITSGTASIVISSHSAERVGIIGSSNPYMVIIPHYNGAVFMTNSDPLVICGKVFSSRLLFRPNGNTGLPTTINIYGQVFK